MEYVKYVWFLIISVVMMFGMDKFWWVWKYVSVVEWKCVGNFMLCIVGWIEGFMYYQWVEFWQIFVQDVGGKKYVFIVVEWVVLGYQFFEKCLNQIFVKLLWYLSIVFFVDYMLGIGLLIDGVWWMVEGNLILVVCI